MARLEHDFCDQNALDRGTSNPRSDAGSMVRRFQDHLGRWRVQRPLSGYELELGPALYGMAAILYLLAMASIDSSPAVEAPAGFAIGARPADASPNPPTDSWTWLPERAGEPAHAKDTGVADLAQLSAPSEWTRQEQRAEGGPLRHPLRSVAERENVAASVEVAEVTIERRAAHH